MIVNLVRRLRFGSRLVIAQARVAVLSGLQYRADFLIQMALSLFWAAAALVPLWVLYRQDREVAGWSWNDALLVVGCFMILKGIIESVIEPSLTQAVEAIRNGKFDAILLRPADAQFLVSTAKIQPWNASDAVAGVVVAVFACIRRGAPPGITNVLLATMMLAAGAVILFAVLGMMISLAFSLVKVDNLIYLFLSLYEAARWPGSVYRGALQVLFTTILPFVVMTTYPAEALRGGIRPRDMAVSAAVAAMFMVIARMAWRSGIKRYTGAGG